MLKAWNHIFVGTAATLLGVLLSLLLLRGYFTNEKMEEVLTLSFNHNDFYVLDGDSQVKKNGLWIRALHPFGEVVVLPEKMKGLDLKRYANIEFDFSNAQLEQLRLLTIQVNGNLVSSGQIESNMGGYKLMVSMPDSNGNDALNVVSLSVRKFVSSFEINTIRLIPKKVNYATFVNVLMDSFFLLKEWDNRSINRRVYPEQVLISIKLLILLVVINSFGAYLLLQRHVFGVSLRRTAYHSWWGFAVLAWLFLDLHYLVEKSILTKHSLSEYAGLSTEEKNLKNSPFVKELANEIETVLDNRSDISTVRIQFGWKEKKLPAREPWKRYVSGKLQYFLAPRTVYVLSYRMPKSRWEEGGFLYVDARPASQRLQFNERTGMLTTELKQVVRARLLARGNDYLIYEVLGGRE